jgi:hypothetical protein
MLSQLTINLPDILVDGSIPPTPVTTSVSPPNIPNESELKLEEYDPNVEYDVDVDFDYLDPPRTSPTSDHAAILDSTASPLINATFQLH